MVVQGQGQIPRSVVEALRYVRESGPPELELCDEETVLYIAHCCGFDEACHWLREHRQLYFEAVRLAMDLLIGTTREANPRHN